jgi:hypothetical protein
MPVRFGRFPSGSLILPHSVARFCAALQAVKCGTIRSIFNINGLHRQHRLPAAARVLRLIAAQAAGVRAAAIENGFQVIAITVPMGQAVRASRKERSRCRLRHAFDGSKE